VYSLEGLPGSGVLHRYRRHYGVFTKSLLAQKWVPYTVASSGKAAYKNLEKKGLYMLPSDMILKVGPGCMMMVMTMMTMMMG
jgi:hypothetical protein